MLESPSLLLRPPAGPGAGALLSEIVDAATGGLVGRVYRRLPSAFWQRWLRPVTLVVHEADEDPLLCTVSGPRPFWPRWHVRDADGHTVGFLRPAPAGHSRSNQIAEIFNPLDQLLAVVRPCEPENEGSRILDLGGAELARLRRESGGIRLTFGGPVRDDPPVKMLVLAAVVVDVLCPA